MKIYILNYALCNAAGIKYVWEIVFTQNRVSKCLYFFFQNVYTNIFIGCVSRDNFEKIR